MRPRNTGPEHVESVGPRLPDWLATAIALQHMPDLNGQGLTIPPVVQRVMRSRGKP